MVQRNRPRDFKDIVGKIPNAKFVGQGRAMGSCPVSGHKTPEGHLAVVDAGDKALVTCHGRNHTYDQICRALGFESLSYSRNGRNSIVEPSSNLSDSEAMDYLKQIYGLNEPTITHFEIRPDSRHQAWRYPVVGGQRYKRYSRQPPNKYWHTQGTSNQLYGIKDIALGTAEIWLVNGEPAVWVMHQAGIPAICCIYGEGNFPRNTIQTLRDKGIKTINIPYDLDEAGQSAAIKASNTLEAAFNISLKQLPSHLGEKGDICDLFVWFGGDSNSFEKALRELPEVEVSVLRNILKKKALHDRNVSLVCMAEIEAVEVSWLWYPYIPSAKLTLLEGDPGIGKSWLSLAIATAISLGNGLPGVEAKEPGKVLLASAEDGLADTIRPRLNVMEANVGKIHAVKGALDFGHGGLEILESFIREVKPALVIIDPLVAYLGLGVDIHRANETRAVMTQLADIAERQNVAIVAIRHLTKGGYSKPIYRGLGSIDFAAACRSVLLAGCDPDDEQKRGLVHIKSNLAQVGRSVGYEVREGHFYWTGESSLTAGQILSSVDTEHVSVLSEVMEFLQTELSDGPVSASQIFKDGRDLGLSEKTIKRAKANLGIITEREGEPGKRGGGRFVWRLTEDLEGQEGHLKNSDPLNNDNYKDAGGTSSVDLLNEEIP